MIASGIRAWGSYVGNASAMTESQRESAGGGFRPLRAGAEPESGSSGEGRSVAASAGLGPGRGIGCGSLKIFSLVMQRLGNHEHTAKFPSR